MIISTAIVCLALNIYHESRSEPIKGQIAVALVTVNRAKGNEKDVCKETFKTKQFSWTSQVRKTQHGWLIPMHLYPKVADKIEERAWISAVHTSQKILSGKVVDFTKGSTHYHAKQVNPNWGLQHSLDIGNHRFYLPKLSKSNLT